MEKALFDELLESVKQATAIERGTMKPSRVFVVNKKNEVTNVRARLGLSQNKFALAGHPKAKRGYAWSFQDKGEAQYVTALEIPPVESPITVVRAAIVTDAKGKK